jgi:sugar phosphate isomerase/epimerase
MERQIGLDHLTLLDIAPPAFVSLAAAAGFDTVGLRISPVTPGEETWPLSPGSPMLAETLLRCADTGVLVHSVEAIVLGPGASLAQCGPVIETAAMLGARYLNVICDDPDTGRFTELFAALVLLGRAGGVCPVIEFTAYRPIRSLDDAVAVARSSGGGQVLLDALHVQRCGVTAAEIAAVEPALLSYLQLCDAPLRQPHGLRAPAMMPRRQRASAAGHSAAGSPLLGDAVIEARAMRLLPGEGELPLAPLLAALPADMLVSVEAPSVAALAALSPGEYAARARHAVRPLAG